MRRFFSLFLVIFIVPLWCPAADKPQKPRLVMGIVVEQMRYEYIYRYWDKFGDNGFKKLLLNGASCRNAHADYMLTQSSPGHATIATGANPCSHGIVADEWFDRVKGRTVYATADETSSLVAGADKDNCGSPVRMATSAMGDELKKLSPASKVISLSTSCRSAILLGGHSANAAYWMDDVTGQWTTSSYYMPALPLWLADFNAKRMPDIYLQKTWYQYLPFGKYTESLPDKNEYEVGLGNQTTFPYQLSTLSDRVKPYRILKSTPQGNALTKDMAVHTIVGEMLGKDASTDMLWVCFSALEAIGLKFGPRSVEMQDAVVQLDREIEFLLAFVEKEVGKDNLLVVLTSNHGVADNTRYLLDNKLPAGQFKKAKAEQLLRSYLNAVYGAKEWITYFNNKSVYLDHYLVEDSRIDLREIQEKSAEFLVKLTGVANVITASSLLSTRFCDGVPKQMFNSFCQKRSGDLLINLEPGWIDQTMTEATAHNSPYNYDTHVPLIWYGWRIEKSSINRLVSLADIAPTIALFLRTPQPDACSGWAMWEFDVE